MTTIDLLLTLGAKIAELLVTVMSQRGAAEGDKTEASRLVQEYKQLQQMYRSLQTLVQRYNQCFERVRVPGAFQELYRLCTPEHYARLYQEYQPVLTNQARPFTTLSHMQILSVSIETHTSHAWTFASGNPASHQHAMVYTRERWMHHHDGGQRKEQDVINCYQLTAADGTWRVSGNEVFTKAR